MREDANFISRFHVDLDVVVAVLHAPRGHDQPPDRQRDVPAIDSGTDPTIEYFYEPSGGTGATRVRVVCANGKVEGVDRSVIR